MTNEINTKEDLLRLWHEDDEFRVASRRELLTNELLELPEKFAENAKQVDSRLERVETRLERVEIDVDGLRGDALERKAPTHLCQLINDALSVRRVQVIWMPGGFATPLGRMDKFAIDVESGADDGTITLEEEGRLNRTDMVARAIREPEGTRLWIAAEISGLIGERDIRRARESAAALRKLYSQETIPVVYGYRIADQQRRSAQAREGLEEVLIFLEPLPRPLREHKTDMLRQ